ncbi:class I SAM-dependent methyltransferase [Mobiluncus curtisii]|nr:methyltransferase [Mobiluncus curtisii]NMW89175.1 methyltransferase [Mobiluncus curtisii]
MSSQPAGEHYFASTPHSEGSVRELTVSLAGRDFRVTTAHGVFSGQGLDKGTAVLLRKVPPLPSSQELGGSGVLVDVGCGWGPLALTLAAERPSAQVYAVDVNARALELTRANATANGLHNIQVLSEADAFAALGPNSVDVIWSNPPVRVGKMALHAMWEAWRTRLKPEGVAYLVMGRNLGSDPFLAYLNEHGWIGEKIASSKGFRVLQLRRSAT